MIYLYLSICALVWIGSAHCVAASTGINFTQCFQDIKTNWIASNDTMGATDSHGHPVSDAFLATGITYDLCVKACGTGSGPFSWSQFSQQFSTWLLPWLALLSQFPFGNRFKYDDIMSIALALGSPCLAAYSLALTVLNNQWVARRFANCQYPNCSYAVRVLSSLQQAPLKVTIEEDLLASLVVLPENDRWWRDILQWLDYADVHTWTIASVTSIGWVIIAYALTVIDAINTVSNDPNGNAQGLSGEGSLWVWTLPICLGYLQLSLRCDAERLNNALNRANEVAYVATQDGAVGAKERGARRALSFALYPDGELYHDQQATAPIYNYSRIFSYAQAVEEIASAFQHATKMASGNNPVNDDIQWERESGAGDCEINPINRRGSPEQVARYCGLRAPVSRSHCGSDIFSRCFIASLWALALQWGTSGASVIIVYFTPTVGIGCRSGAYLLYAGGATVIWTLFLATSLVGHYATARVRDPDFFHRLAARVAVFLRRLAKLLSVCNAVWIITVFLLQFGNFYDRCYCDANVFSLGKGRGYSEMVLTASEISVMKAAWIGGIALALAVSGLFLAFINTFNNLPLPPRVAP